MSRMLCVSVCARARAVSAITAAAALVLPCGVRAVAAAPMTLLVDAREAPRNILHVQMTIPAAAGDLTLYYPKWVPGEHGPTNPLANLATLTIEAGGARLPWQRDLVDLYAFHLRVPQGVNALRVSFDFLMTQDDVMGTPELLLLNWNRVVLYPGGTPVSAISVVPSIVLPQGWQYGCALPSPQRSGDRVDFGAVSLETLIDSPLDAGKYYRRTVLLSEPGASNELDLFVDTPASLDAAPEYDPKFKNMVAQADALYGWRSWSNYHFLLALSDAITPTGIEHRDSSDNRDSDTYLSDPHLFDYGGDLLPHEFSHSWNGKYRRPAELATDDYQQPEKTDLLWVYEGLNQYLGDVLSYRSGLREAKEYPEYLASLYAALDYEPGRLTTPLGDITTAAPYLYQAPKEWTQARRNTDDFYNEGELVWLDADSIIRQASHGTKSLDTFVKAFFAPVTPMQVVRTYTYQDVVAALSAVQPYDWNGFFQSRVYAVTAHPPSDWLERAGYRLSFTETPNTLDEYGEETRHWLDLRYSLGIVAKTESDDSSPGEVRDVLAGSPAAKAGLGAGVKIIAVNWREFSADAMHAAMKASRSSLNPVTLIVQSGKTFQLIDIDYHGGERYPHLERIAGAPDMLATITAPR